VSCCYTRHVSQNIHDPRYTLNYTLHSGDNCPSDTSDGQESDTGNNSSQTSSNSSETKSRRVQIKSRGALFNGSRNGSLSSGRDDDEDDDDKNNSKLPRLLHQCEATALKESEMTEHDDHQPDDTYNNHEGSAQSHPQKSQTAVANSTQINLNESVYPAFDMSLLNGISYSLGSMWKSAKNVSLFGTNLHQDKDCNTFERPIEDDPNISEISNISGLSNISELSFVSIQNTTLLEENVPINGHITDTDTNKVDVGHHDTEDKGNNKNVTTYTGTACPEITPTAPRLKGRIRTRSENSPLTRTGPYDIPPSHLLRKKQRANLKSLSSFPNQTPVIKRKRNLSESIGISPSHSKGGIDCVRVRDPGLYNCSAGLGSYIHLEHNYLDKQDTGRIDRGKLMAEISKALSIHGDDISHQETDISVNMAWCEEEIEAVTKKHSNRTTLHPIDQRNCLLYLLSRLNIHQTRLLSNKPNFNGLKLTILPERTEKFPIKCHPDSDGQPITLLYLSNNSRCVNIIAKKLDQKRLSVYDIELENNSLLTIFPDTYQHMNISLPSEGIHPKGKGDFGIIITPCFVKTESTLDLATEMQQTEVLNCSVEHTEILPDSSYPEKTVSNSFSTSEKKTPTESNEAEQTKTVSNSCVPVETSANDLIEVEHAMTVQNTSTPEKTTGADPAEAEKASSVSNTSTPEKTTASDPVEKATVPDSNKAEQTKTASNTSTPEKTTATDSVEADHAMTAIKSSTPEKVTVTESNKAEQNIKTNTSHPEETTAPAPPSVETQSTIDPSKESAPDAAFIDTKTLKLFLSKETLVQLVDRNSKPKIIELVKLCHMRAAHTSEQNRKMVLDHLLDASQGKVKLQPSLIDKLVKRLNDEAVTAELMNMGLEVPKSARMRKNALETYLNDEFSTLNLSDFNETCRLEKSRIGSPKTKKQNPKGKKNKNNKKTRATKKTNEKAANTTTEMKSCANVTPVSNEQDDQITENTDEPSAQDSKTAKCFPTTPEEPAEPHETVPKKGKPKIGRTEETKPDPTNQAIGSLGMSNAAFEKPLKILENSILKLQETTSNQQAQLELFKKDQIAKSVDAELSDLKSKVLSLLEMIKIQQSTLDNLINQRSTQEQQDETSKALLTKPHKQMMNRETQTTNPHDHKINCRGTHTETSCQTDQPVYNTSPSLIESKETQTILMIREVPTANNIEQQQENKETPHSRADQTGEKPQTCTPSQANKAVLAAANKIERQPENKETPPSKADQTEEKPQTSTPSQANKVLLPTPIVANKAHGQYAGKKTAKQEVSKKDNQYDKSYSHRDGSVSSHQEQNKETTPPRSTNDTNKKPRCLLVLDDQLNEFESDKFSKQFDINTYKVFSVNDILSRGGLVAKIKNVSYETVFLHVGLQDLHWLKTTPEDLHNKYKQLIYKLLETTNTRICVSQIIPIKGYPYLNERIQQVNEMMFSLISSIRLTYEYKKRIFTSCNDNLANLMTRTVGSHGIELTLSPEGKRKMWLLVKDSLQRTLGLNRDRIRKLNISRYTNKNRDYD